MKGTELIWSLFTKAVSLISTNPVAGIGLIGISCLLLFFLVSVIETQTKRWMLYGTLLLLLFFVLLVLSALGVQIQPQLNELLLKWSEGVKP